MLPLLATPEHFAVLKSRCSRAALRHPTRRVLSFQGARRENFMNRGGFATHPHAPWHARRPAVGRRASRDAPIRARRDAEFPNDAKPFTMSAPGAGAASP